MSFMVPVHGSNAMGRLCMYIWLPSCFLLHTGRSTVISMPDTSLSELLATFRGQPCIVKGLLTAGHTYAEIYGLPPSRSLTEKWPHFVHRGGADLLRFLSTSALRPYCPISFPVIARVQEDQMCQDDVDLA